MQQIGVALNIEDYDRLQRVLALNETVYSFVKETILKAIREKESGKDPSEVSTITQQMIEALSERKRYIYQMGAYSDQNHRDWLEGRFPSATKREVIDAVARWRAAGGQT